MCYRRIIMVLLCLSLSNKSTAQNCIHTNLSNKYNYQVVVKKHKIRNELFRDAVITLNIYQKKNNQLLQALDYKCDLMFEDVFKKCDATRSYITNYHRNMEVLDYDYGDLVIADLNFDGKEDIAIKHDSGGNGGPLYNFYLQDEKGKFKIDRYLTDTVWSFPKYFNAKRKTIATQIHANVGQEQRATYQYIAKTKKWKIVKWTLIND